MTARVLVVDDIFANVKLLQARLSVEYFDVLTAHSGREALDLLETERADVVLLDVMMPVMDGFEVCRRIKNESKTMHLPVVLVTALDQPSDKIQGLKAGADDFLSKPVDDIALITRVNAQRLRRNTRSADLVCRMGGEEFIVVMPDTLLERARQAGEPVCSCIAAEPFRINPTTQLDVTASVGLATLEPSDEGLEALFNRADQALYAAKREGRNRVVADAA